MVYLECFGTAFVAIGDGGLGWALAPIAFIVAAIFIVSGILLSQEYMNGVYTTMAAFLISGTLSIIFTGEDLNPLSISFAEGGLNSSINDVYLTSIGIAALPLLFSEQELKQGWPTAIERLIGKKNPGKEKLVAHTVATSY